MPWQTVGTMTQGHIDPTLIPGCAEFDHERWYNAKLAAEDRVDAAAIDSMREYESALANQRKAMGRARRFDDAYPELARGLLAKPMAVGEGPRALTLTIGHAA